MLLKNEMEIVYICCGEGKSKSAAMNCLKEVLPIIREPEIRQAAASAYQKISEMTPDEFSKLDFSEAASEYAEKEAETPEK